VFPVALECCPGHDQDRGVGKQECVGFGLVLFGEGEFPMCAERESDNVLRLLFIVTMCTKSDSTVWIKVSNARREGNTEE